MALPDRNNPYSFDDFLERRQGLRFVGSDPFFQKALRCYAGERSDVEADLARFDEALSTRWAALANEAGRAENAPSMIHHDAYNRRIDRIVRPAATLSLEKDVWAEAMFAPDADPWTTFTKIFLLTQLGEAGINCAHCCTGGLVRILQRFADTPELDAILAHLTEGRDGDYGIGAQFLSEVQGGSDVRANRVEAVHGEDGWRLYGTKYYCSAAHADYALVTAKPAGSHEVATFVVPMWLPGDKAVEKRNGHVINKLKDKLGTRELPTAEITFDGALAHPVGDPRRGLANIMAIVIHHSRFVTGLGAIAHLIRAHREAECYAAFRTAFGVTIQDFGLVARQLAETGRGAKRGTASTFKLQRAHLDLAAREADPNADRAAVERERFRLRVLVQLHKLVACDDAARLTEVAMSIFGANGLMEDFSSLPRLYRDGVVLNGAWEGPRNLLLTRNFLDLKKAIGAGYAVDELLGEWLPDADSPTRDRFAAELVALTAHPSLTGTDAETLAVCDRWDRLCFDLFHAYQDAAVQEVERTP